MAEVWLPDVERIEGNDAGSMNGDGSRKILLHSTQGSSIAGAVGAYRDHNSWPTLTVDCPRRQVVEHLPLNVAARALQNDPGGADQTNKDGTIHVQIELVGFAERPASIGDADDLDWLGRHVIGPIARLTGVPLRSDVAWRAYPSSYGERAAQRLTPAEWDAYSGILGHQHAPDNDHGDPGLIDIDRILAAARREEDDMPSAIEVATETVRLINDRLQRPGSVIRTRLAELSQLGAERALVHQISTAYTDLRKELRSIGALSTSDAVAGKLDELGRGIAEMRQQLEDHVGHADGEPADTAPASPA